jgi:hypothetical protein
MSRQDFLAHPDRNKIKDGPYVCSCSFKESPTHRCDDNADALQLVIFDMDDSDVVRPFFEDPQALSEILWPNNFVLYETANHRPEAPRMKLVVDVEECPVSYHRAIVRHIASRLGMPQKFKGEVETRTLSQPQYRPVQFAGDEFSAILASRTDGIPLSYRDIPEEEANEEAEERTYAFNGDLGTDLGLLYLPVMDLTVEDVRPILDHLDPDLGYVQWREVASALRHQFRVEEDARDAFHLFEEWSARGNKHKEGEPYKKWKSFRPDTIGGKAPITIRTLFKHAMTAGWNPKKVQDKLKLTTEAWIAACEDHTELMDEGCRRIAAMPFPNAVLEDALVCVLRKRIKELTGNTIDKGAIKKQLAAEKFHKKAEAQKGSSKPNWLSPWVFVSTTNTFYNATTRVELAPPAFDNTYSIHLMPKDDKDNDEPSNGRPYILPTHFALNQLAIDRVDETLYCPVNGGSDPIIEISGKRCLNTYSSAGVPLEDPETAEEAGALFTNHISTFIAEPEYQTLFLDFVCHTIQFPGKKIRWAMLLQSGEGVGKGFLTSILAAVIGKRHIRGISPTVMRSQWNDWAVGALLIILEEIHIPGEQREIVMNSLKQAISDDYLMINKRNTSAQEVPNYANFLGFTNNVDAIHLKPSDRRWCVIQSPLQSKEAIVALTETGHFVRLEALLGPLAGGLRYWLLNRKISPDFPVNGPAPKTIYRDEVIRLSRNQTQIAVEDILHGQDYPTIAQDLILEADLLQVLGPRHDKGRVTHCLRTMGFLEWDHGHPARLDGYHRSPLWYHRDKFFLCLETPEEVANQRVKKMSEDS